MHIVYLQLTVQCIFNVPKYLYFITMNINKLDCPNHSVLKWCQTMNINKFSKCSLTLFLHEIYLTWCGDYFHYRPPGVFYNLYLPIIVVAPCSVALTTASIMAFVPLLKLANSNTPGGL
jgi:hypothetical protein